MWYKLTAQLLSLTESKSHLFWHYFIGWTIKRWTYTQYLNDIQCCMKYWSCTMCYTCRNGVTWTCPYQHLAMKPARCLMLPWLRLVLSSASTTTTTPPTLDQSYTAQFDLKHSLLSIDSYHTHACTHTHTHTHTCACHVCACMRVCMCVCTRGCVCVCVCGSCVSFPFFFSPLYSSWLVPF